MDIDLETGPEKGWEIKQAKEKLHSIAESRVLAFTLLKSREEWVTSVFPKLSSQRKKGPKVEAPPHDLHLRGSCDVQIGPHIFSDTTFYEAHYRPSTSSQSLENQNSPYTGAFGSASTSLVGNSGSSSTSLVEPTMATPAFIGQINAAAASDPILAHLLHLVTAGKADQAQLQTLSTALKELANTTFQSIQEFDMIVEFQEAPFDRFIFPRGTTVCERILNNENDIVMVITSYVQLQGKDSTQNITGELLGNRPSKPRMLRMTLYGASEILWDSFNRWAGGEEQMKESKRILDQLKQKQLRETYLAYHLPTGTLLDQLRAATSPPYPSKSLKPSAAAPGRPRRVRRAGPKEPPAQNIILADATSSAKPSPALSTVVGTTTKSAKRKRHLAETDNLNAAMDLAAAITGAASSVRYSPTHTAPSPSLLTPSILPAVTTATSTSSLTSIPVLKKQKKRMFTTTISRPAPEIKCGSCQATEVPLLMGGRFCRPCVDAGRATVDIPRPPSYASRASAAYTPMNMALLDLPSSFTRVVNPIPDPTMLVSYGPDAINVGDATLGSNTGFTSPELPKGVTDT